MLLFTIVGVIFCIRKSKNETKKSTAPGSEDIEMSSNAVYQASSSTRAATTELTDDGYENMDPTTSAQDINTEFDLQKN